MSLMTKVPHSKPSPAATSTPAIPAPYVSQTKPSPAAPYAPTTTRPSPTAPLYAPTAPYAVATAAEADKLVKESSLRTKAHEQPSTGNSSTTNNSNNSNNSNQEVTNVEIELQPNDDPGIVFDANFLCVLQLTKPIPSLTRQGTHIEGYYFHSLRLPGLEITNVVHEQQLIKIMTANRHLPRILVVSSHLPPTSSNGCHYKHDLPTTDNLGIHFSGFPARVQSVDKDSPMVGKIHPGQSVNAVIIPGLADLKIESEGFTGSRVAEHLQTHCHVPHKQLIVMDQPILAQDKTSSDSCECLIL
jgi:hypothetical protein